MLRIAWKLFVRDSKMRKNTVVQTLSFFLLMAGYSAKTYLFRTYGGSEDYEVSLLVNGFTVFFRLCFFAVNVMTAVTVLLEIGYSRQEITLLQNVGYTEKQVLSFESFKYGSQACISFLASGTLYCIAALITVSALPAAHSGMTFSCILVSLMATAVIPLTAYACVYGILHRSGRKM